ncbi:MAG: hypothetical protein ACRC1F_00180 [Metamycoplasmataceae bacterium]
MFSKFKKIFKLSNWKRWTISSISLITMGIGITIGSIYSVSNNNPTNDYKPGAEVVLKITDIDETPEIIKRQIEQRLNLTLPEDSNYEVILNSNDFLTIKGTNIQTDGEMEAFTSFIKNKQKISVTTLELDASGRPKILPFQFTNATMSGDSITLTLGNKVAESGEILIWRNLDELINLATTSYNDEWTAVNRDPYKFLFVNGVTEGVDNGPQPILKTESFGGFDALDYLISKNNPTSNEIFEESIVVDFSFAPKITTRQKEEIFYNLDFSVSSYNLDLQTYNFIQPSLGNNAYQFLIIASAVAFSFISVFLIVNYGLLGALSTICAAFLVFLGLLMITVFRGEYSPEAIAALMVAVGIGLDFNIAFFERFKKELKSGNSLQKSLKKADKLTLSSSITKSISLIITSVIVYVIGSLYLGTFSSLILIMSIFLSVIMFILIRVLANLILGTKTFDNKHALFGIYKKNIKSSNLSLEKNETENLIEVEEVKSPESKTISISKKISVVVLGLFATAGIALFTSFSILGSGWMAGVNAGGDVTRPTILKSKNQFSLEEANNFKLILVNELGITADEITMKSVNEAGDKYLIEVSTTKTIDDLKIIELGNQGLELVSFSVLFESVNDAILSVFYIALASIIAMSIFVLMRSDWTYGLSMFLGLTIAIILFMIIFTFQIITFNTLFLITSASAILIAVSNNLTVLFRIKEKLKNRKSEELVKSELKDISNIAIKDSFKRLLISNGLMLSIFIIFSVLPGAIPLDFTIPLLIFIIISVIVSITIVPFFFIRFKAFKSKRKRDKILNNHWETQIIQEQIFPTINDIN